MSQNNFFDSLDDIAARLLCNGFSYSEIKEFTPKEMVKWWELVDKNKSNENAILLQNMRAIIVECVTAGTSQSISGAFGKPTNIVQKILSSVTREINRITGNVTIEEEGGNSTERDDLFKRHFND